MKSASPRMRIGIALLLAGWAAGPVRGEDRLPVDAMGTPLLEAVDIPTADILDPARYQTDFRFYSQGGVLSRLLVSPFKRVGIGVEFDVQHMIGGGEPRTITPDIWFKLRFFDGTDVLPAFALGYDSQGYLYQESTKDFLHEERGLYLVGGHEIFVPNFFLHGGVNFPEVEDGKIHGFFGATYRFIPSFALLMEYDHLRNGPGNRFNVGGRFFVTGFFFVDVAARNIGRNSDRGAERTVRLAYTARFPF